MKNIFVSLNIVVFPARSRFPVKLICFFVFGLASSACCLLKPLLSSYYIFWNMDNLATNQLRNHLFDCFQFFECCLMFSYNFLLGHEKKFLHQSLHCNLLFLQLGKIPCIYCLGALFSNYKTKSIYSMKIWTSKVI